MKGTAERALSPLELMRMHVEALYTFDVRGRMQRINEWDGGTPPRFFLGRTAGGHVWRHRADIPDDLAGTLDTLCESGKTIDEDECIRLLAVHAPIERVWRGPAYSFTDDVVPTAEPVAIDAGNAALLRSGFEAWLPDVPHRRPFFAIVEDGRAVAICASVRITRAAHEAGVETLPSHRGRGHAANVVAGWARAVRALGAAPLYSTSWDNTASQRVAAKLRLSMYGVDFHVT